jgi:hypothetical protein
MVMEMKDRLSFVVQLVVLGLLFKQNKILATAQQGNVDKYNPTPAFFSWSSWLRKYWPMLVMAVLMLSSWIPYLLDGRRRSHQAAVLATVIEEKRQFSMTINSLNCEIVERGRLLKESVDRESKLRIGLGRSAPEKKALIPNVSQGAGSAFSLNQSGGITAGTLNVDTRKHLKISDVQQTEVTNALRNFSGRKASIFFSNQTPETYAFGEKLKMAMEAAGIMVETSEGTTYMHGTLPPGVSLYIGDDNADIAKALAGC